jgi:polyhydroxyalkanoate synthase
VARDTASIDAVLDGWRRAPFAIADAMRRAQGDAVAAFGLGPSECPYRIVAAGSHWRLRDYGGSGGRRPLLIVAAPIKRPYIWDLAPSVSAIRTCLAQDLHVHLVEWMPASPAAGNCGLDECAAAISRCVAHITDRGALPVVVGHSLGGTLAAIHAALAADRIRALVLLSAPLCFQPAACHFRDALVSLVPPDLCETEPFPGSLLSHMSALASPKAFVWERFMDAALSAVDAHAMDIHARVERWALDEVPLPGRLVHQIIEWLYRENRLCRGTLQIDGMLIGPASLSAPTLAVVNTADDVAPMTSVRPFIDALATKRTRIIEHSGEVGVGLQHLAILVGRQAHARVWPEIVGWIKALG